MAVLDSPGTMREGLPTHITRRDLTTPARRGCACLLRVSGHLLGHRDPFESWDALMQFRGAARVSMGGTHRV